MDERERDAAEVAATAGAADDDIRIFAGHFHLLQGFLPDDGLVHQDVVQHRTKRILILAAAGRRGFHRFTDGDAK